MPSSSNKNDDGIWWQPSLILFGRLSGWIGAPVILALFLGRWLDEKYNTEPWLFIATVVIAFIISSIGIGKEAVGAMKKMEEEDKKKDEKKKSLKSFF